MDQLGRIVATIMRCVAFGVAIVVPVLLAR